MLTIIKLTVRSQIKINGKRAKDKKVKWHVVAMTMSADVLVYDKWESLKQSKL